MKGGRGRGYWEKERGEGRERRERGEGLATFEGGLECLGVGLNFRTQS